MREPLYIAGAVGYDEAFARVARSFVPTLLKAARIAPGHHWAPPRPLEELAGELRELVCEIQEM